VIIPSFQSAAPIRARLTGALRRSLVVVVGKARLRREAGDAAVTGVG
jgi:hypothetical protein